MQRSNTHSRVRLLTYLCMGVMALFVVRLFYLQIIQHGKYVEMAEAEQVKTLMIPALRGEIYALDEGTPVPIVLNQDVYTVFADPVSVAEPDKIVSLVKKVAGGEARSNLGKLVRAKPSRYEILATDVTRKQAQLMKDENLAGLGFQKTTRRVYPEGKLASQILGFVNNDGIGQYGIEQGLNKELTGKSGVLKSVTDISNVPLTIGDKNVKKPAKDGKNVVLTIDRNIQAYAQQAIARQVQKLGGTGGSVIVMEPQTGKVLAMANYPTYSPADYNKVTNAAAFDNAVVTSPYEPGSVMKTFTAATAIDRGVIEPTSTYTNTDHINVDGSIISNASLGQTGVITFQHALNWSLNTGYVTVAERLGGLNDPPGKADINRKARDIIYDYFYKRFKLGQMTGIPLAGEQPGVIVPPNEVQGNAVRYSNMTFGQGLDVTMLQVASGFCAMVNGGIYHAPSIVAGEMSPDGTFERASAKSGSRIISAETSRKTTEMVHKARKAFFAGTDLPGYYIGGKTGTSQNIVNGKYSDTAFTATYLGFGGDTTPRYVIMVRVLGDGLSLGGDTAAMPVFNDVSNWMINYLKLRPRG